MITPGLTLSNSARARKLLNKSNRREAGFTLLELLIVVALIGIITAIAVPNIIAARRSANEASAISALRLLHTAQASYFSTHDQFSPTLRALADENLIDTDIADGTKNGYTFTETSSINITSGLVKAYEYYADPV